MPSPSSPASLVVVIPAHNEAGTVADVIADVQRELYAEVVVVDDCSADDTAQRAREAGATVLSLAVQLGAWGATQTGIRFARRQGVHQVITMDADGQHHASQARRLLDPDAQNADLVIGTCPARLSRAKRTAWKYFALITGLRLNDFTSGLRLYRKRALRLLASAHASLLDYQDVGVLLLLSRQGLGIREVPVDMSERTAGVSRVFNSWFTVARYMFQTTVLCVARVHMGRRKAPRTP